MKRLSLFAACLFLALSACYNPELAPAPFLCGEGGICPQGYKCYGGICMKDKPECMMPGFIFPGEADKDLEPNNKPELATDLPCADPFSSSYDPCSCPVIATAGTRRSSYQNGLQGLGICPAGDKDFYRIYLYAGEVLQVTLIYQYNVGRDLNLAIYQLNPTTGLHDVKDQSSTTNDNEELSYEAPSPDWYYIGVEPANVADVINPDTGEVMRPADLNEYILQFVLNPPACNDNGTCEPYETNTTCSDCPAPPDPAACGNLICEPGETGCQQDCFCGNGTCDPSVGENPTVCPTDCPQC